MRISPRELLAYLLSALTMTGMNSVRAQVERSGGGGSANAQLVQQYQEATSERDKLQGDNAKLKSDLDAANKKLAAAQQQLAAAKTGADAKDAAIASAQAARDSSAKNLEDLKGKMEELIAKFRETTASLRGVELDRAKVEQQLAQSRSAFDQCAMRNYDFYKLNGEILDRYEHQGAFTYLARAEPFTRIKRTQLENMVDEYRQRAEELQQKRESTGTAPSAVTPKATDTAAPPSGAAGSH
jgi:chaperonin cofactor prefoldin